MSVMKKIRVLIVDDSVVIRKLVGDGLAQDQAIEVVGAAANGKIALQKIPQCNPDLVTLDIEMPEMDGLETLKHIRVDYPRLPVIMFSTLTERGASTTLEALSLGASDYVTKPANVGGINEGAKKIHDDLIPKIKSLCGYHAIVATSPLPTFPQVPRRPITAAASAIRADRHVSIVAIGTSTGGPNALADVLPEFPKDFPVPIVIVQHMPPLFTKLLADRLNAKSSISVFEGQAGTILQPGCAYLAPGDFHMTVERKAAQIVLGLNREPFENSCRPAVDVLFRTVGDIYGDSVLAVIMTGMGQDGLRGCETIRGAGGQIVTQDEASSVVWGMPGFVTKAGLADCVLPLKEIAREIVRRTMKNRKLPQTPVLDSSRVGIAARQG